MEVGDKLKELNMTADEMERLTKAFKDEKFREMLRDYAAELSDPENKKRYEEEIKLLEQERGNTIEFIHPEPFRALRTSVNGKQKCFINICANEKIGKPTSKCGVSEEGRRGQCWSLPHSLSPGRQDVDSKGSKIMIFDVVFHPDTLYIASKNSRFMNMVESTAIQGIQDAFKVTLDKSNLREMSTKYKGSQQPCVIRRAIPGFKAKEPSEKPDPLAFPYPEDKRPSTTAQTKPSQSPMAKIHPGKTKEPTKPNYTVKYRSFIDLQDFRCSRDSAQSPRPKEIVVTIDVPLLRAVTDASLEINEKTLLLECNKPAYRLELPLAYPVDEDEGEAKFNKQKGQLTVTLPVLPSNEGLESGGDRSWEERNEREGLRGEEQRRIEEQGGRETEEEDLKQQTRGEKVEEEEERGQEKEEEMREEEKEIVVEEVKEWERQIHKGQENVVEEEKVEKQKLENEEEAGKLNQPKKQQCKELGEDECDREMEKRESSATSFQWDTVDRCMDASVASSDKEKQPDHPSCMVTEGELDLTSCSESTPKITTSDVNEETEKIEDSLDGNQKMETAAVSSEAMSSTSADPQIQSNTKDGCVSKVPASRQAPESSRGGSGDRVTLCSEELVTESVKREEESVIDKDYPQIEQSFQNPWHADHSKPPHVLLREIDSDGNEKVISDHTTSAGFTFQNSLMYELD